MDCRTALLGFGSFAIHSIDMPKHTTKASPLVVATTLLTLSIVVLGAATYSIWHGRAPHAAPGINAAEVVLPPIRASEYWNTSAEARYVGSERCGECHAAEYASYLKTAHSKSLKVVDADAEPPNGEYLHELSASALRAYRAGGALRHREALRRPDGAELELVDLPLKYLVGSGRYSRTYLAEVEGFLVESPLTWYASINAWRMSPGYDQPSHLSFRRYIGFDCLYCHAGQVEAQGGNHYRLNLREMAIGCERCHGPGSLHVERHEKSDDRESETPTGNGQKASPLANSSRDLSIVNPRRLRRDLAESVCQQCHLETVASAIVRGRRREDFRPGLAWNDFCMNYVHETATGEMTVTGHVEQMRQSRCYQASETLTCLSCHNPHETPGPEERLAYFRKACLQCHQDEACRISPDSRQARNGNDCAACHMPQSPTDITHVAFTHHRIGVHVEGNTDPPATNAAMLLAVLGAEHLPEVERKRLLGLAYLRAFLDHQHDARYREFAPRAQALIREAAAGGVADADMFAAEALLSEAVGESEAAHRAAQRALEEDSLSAAFRAPLLGLVGRFHLHRSRPAEALPYFTRAASERLDPGDWFLIGLCQRSLRDRPAAIAAFERARGIDPRQPETYELLEPLYRAEGDEKNAMRCRNLGEILRNHLPAMQDAPR